MSLIIPVLVVVLPDEALAHARLPVAAVVRHSHGPVQKLGVLRGLVCRDQGLGTEAKARSHLQLKSRITSGLGEYLRSKDT